jgi:hypothetical protein
MFFFWVASKHLRRSKHELGFSKWKKTKLKFGPFLKNFTRQLLAPKNVWQGVTKTQAKTRV